MNASELMNYLFKDGSHPLIPRFTHWLNSSTGFWTSVDDDRNRNKIRSKITRASGDREILTDVQSELEIAFLLLQQGCLAGLEYEKYGAEAERNPDLTATLESGVTFNVEVKRIRVSPLQRRFEDWEEHIRRAVHGTNSPLALKILITNRQELMLEWETDLLDRLEEKESDIIKYILSILAAEEQCIETGQVLEYSVPDFEQELTLAFTKPSRKPLLRTSWYGVSKPVFYAKDYQKQGEYRKFGDAICAAIRQLRPNEINVVVITSASETHDATDLEEAIDRLWQQAQKEKDNFFKAKDFKRTSDFIRQFDQLSCVVFKSSFIKCSRNDEIPNILWSNKRAHHHLPEHIGEILRQMR